MRWSANDYRQVARQTLTNDEPRGSLVVEFTIEVFSLARDSSRLEANVSEHEFNWRGLSPAGLDDLEERLQKLSVRFADIQRVISDPDTYLQGYFENDVDDNTATRLRTAVHSHGDLDRILEQIRSAQSRVSSEIAAKRSHLTTTRGLFISLLSTVVALLALGTTVASNTIWT